MGYIKKLKNNELIGGTDNNDVYPITSTQAVYDGNNTSQEYLNNHITTDRVVNSAITNPKLADSAVSMNKLDTAVKTLIQQCLSSAWIPKGNYSETTEYDANDVVYDGVTNSSYLSLKADNIGHPVTDTEWWMVTVDGSEVNTVITGLREDVADAIADAQGEISDLIVDSAEELAEATQAANDAAAAAQGAVYEAVDENLSTSSILPVQNKAIGSVLLQQKQNVTAAAEGYYNGLAKTACSVGATFSTSTGGSGNWYHQRINTIEGDTFYITATGSSAQYSYCFIGSDGKVTVVGTQNASNKKVTAGSDDAALMINGVQSAAFSIAKDTKLIDKINTQDTKLQSQIEYTTNFTEVLASNVYIGDRFFVYNSSILSVWIPAYSETATSNIFRVYKDGSLIYTKSAVDGECPRWCYLDGGTLYFASVIRASLLDSGTSTQDTIKLFTLDLSTLAWSQVGPALTRDMLYRVRYHYTFVSFCKFGDTIYASMSNMETGSSTNQKIELYSISGEGFTLVGNIATHNERWGVGTSEVLYLNYPSPAYGTLSTDGTYLYCRYITGRDTVLLKRTSDLSTWEKYEILGATGFRLDGTLGDCYLPLSHPLYYGYWNNNQYGVCTNEKDEYKYMNIDSLILYLSKGSSVKERSVISSGNYLYICSRYVYNGGYKVSVWRCNNYELYSMMCGKSISDIYTNDISAVPFGSAAIMTKGGSTGLYKYNSQLIFNINYTAPASETITIPYKGIVKVMNLGTNKGYYAHPISYGEDIYRSVFLHHYPFYNEFQSLYFRSPNVWYSTDGKIIHGMGTARYVGLGDAVLMEPIYGRSFDGGRTWVDKRVLVKRPTGTTPSGGTYSSNVRIAGMFFISDTNEASTYYGRLYAMGLIVNNANNSDFVADLQVIVMHTDDNGTTWHGAWDNSDADGSYIDITSQIVPENWEELGWKRLCLSDNQGKTFVGGSLNGMLYTSMWIDYGNTDYKPALVYSTDSGQTWHLGAIASTGNESAIVQKDDHTLLMNTRPNYTGASQRLFYQMDLSNGVANGVWESVSGTNSSTQVTQEGWAKINDIYLLSRPTATDSQGYLKSKITLFKSRDLSNWEKIVVLTPRGTRNSNAYITAISYSNILVNREHLGVMLESKEGNIEYYNLDYLLSYVLS